LEQRELLHTRYAHYVNEGEEKVLRPREAGKRAAVRDCRLGTERVVVRVLYKSELHLFVYN
jgi:hypothetical protein